jgi:aerobic carbon-monoxide dehydrogenase small subunit
MLEEKIVTIPINLHVNGKAIAMAVEPRTLLVELLREHLGLTGTHVACDTAQCGACTVLIDGKAVKSCNVLAAQIPGTQVTSIEGLAQSDAKLHPMQEAFREHHGLQCGFCTPGMIMSAIELAGKYSDPTDEQIRAELDGNLCRCTGYYNIVKSIKAGLAAMRNAS